MPSRVKSTVGETIRTILMADAPTVALIGSRIYPGELPQGSTLPAATYTVVSNVPENSLDGKVATTLKASRVQVDVYARPDVNGGAYAQAQALATCIRSVLGDLSDSDLTGFLENEADTFDNVTKYHGVRMDFTIWL